MRATWFFGRRQREFLKSSALAAITAAVALLAAPVRADQGGISFWLPGAFGSLAATPVAPGWAMGTIFLNEFVSPGGEVASSRAIRLGNATTNLNVTLDARLTFAISPSVEANMAARPVIRK